MSNRTRSRHTILTAAAAAVLLGLAGCGASTEPAGQLSETDAPASPSAAETPASPEPAASSHSPEGSTEPTDGGSADSPGAAPGVDDNDPGLCDAADLAGSIKDLPGGAAAGSVYRGLVLNNTSDESCVLLGYPGVSYVEHDGGAPLGSPAVRDDSKPSVSIDLGPGQEAMAILKQTNAQNYGDRCDQVQAEGVLVYPPSAYDSLFIEQDIPACANEAIELMSIGAFQPAE